MEIWKNRLPDTEASPPPNHNLVIVNLLLFLRISLIIWELLITKIRELLNDDVIVRYVVVVVVVGMALLFCHFLEVQRLGVTMREYPGNDNFYFEYRSFQIPHKHWQDFIVSAIFQNYIAFTYEICQHVPEKPLCH